MKEKTDEKKAKNCHETKPKYSKLWDCPLSFSGEPGKSIIRQRLIPG